MRRVGVSVAIAAVILIAEYFVGNWLGFLFDDSSTLSIFKIVFSDEKEDADNDVWYINVGYDKELVDVKIPNSNKAGGWDTIGRAVVTDRNTLLKILEIAEKGGCRYLFLDVRFEKGLESDLDSMLFAKIKNMKNIVVSTHKEDADYEITDRSLLDKAAYADYESTYFSGFTKYKYLQRDTASVALKMFSDMDGGNIKRVGPFFFFDGKLCNNMQFLTFSDDDINASSITPAFGGETLTRYNDEQIAEMMKGRIIVVGDMVNDVHSTYAGRVAGPVLNYRAYKSLTEGRHVVDWRLVLFLLVVYGVCAYLILYAHSINIPEKTRMKLYSHPLIVFLLLNMGWSIVMFIVKLVAFYRFKSSMIIIIPTLVFSVLSMPDEYSKFKKSHELSNDSDGKDGNTSNEHNPDADIIQKSDNLEETEKQPILEDHNNQI
ncbi:MAG: hypothetical protein K2M16_03115 [Muribaculaceae bacterium]|nr:hypothetical protein [Muribaculaceae bacterium]